MKNYKPSIFPRTSTSKPFALSRKPLLLIFAFVALLILYSSTHFYHESEAKSSTTGGLTQITPHVPVRFPLHQSANVGLVASKSKDEDIEWIYDFCRAFGCTPYIYSVADEPEPGFLPAASSVGHEANAYLTYIVNHYDDLHQYTLFIHGKADNWHNDAGGSKTYDQLPNLRFEAVDRKGYVNLRCLDHPGCPNSLKIDTKEKGDVENQHLVDNFPQIYSEIFGVDPSEAPAEIGHHCCAQFAVTKEKIQAMPRGYYERILNWVVKTQWASSFGIGWMMEKLWHIVFGMPAVHCNPVVQCRCDLYGWCGPNPALSGVMTPIQ